MGSRWRGKVTWAAWRQDRRRQVKGAEEEESQRLRVGLGRKRKCERREESEKRKVSGWTGSFRSGVSASGLIFLI